LKKPLHVLYLVRWYPHKFDNMYGLFVKRHAEAAAIKHRVSVLYVHACAELPVKHEIEVKKGFINEYFYYYRKAKTGISILDKILNNWQFIRGHLALKRKISKPDIIHVHILTRLGVIALWENKMRHIPYIVTEHWSRYQKGNRGYTGFLRKYLTRISVSHAAALTTVTKNLMEAMEAHKIKNQHSSVLNNVVDTKVFFPANKSNKKSDLIQLIHVSCFDDEPKNISGLIDCIYQLSKQRNDFRVDMVGTGRDFDKMVNKTKELGLYNTLIFFKGQLEGIHLGDAVRNADIMMLFSNYENLPVVINEAFCCGVPVIATDVGGIKEVVNSTNGRLVKKGDQAAFVAQLNEMMDHLETYDQKQIHQNAINQFSAISISEKLDEIYLKNSYH
jgi:glycosyltransferase involved in cell wall biosynthesis